VLFRSPTNIRSRSKILRRVQQAALGGMQQGDIVKAHCNRCSGERNHFIIHVHEEEWSEDLGDQAWISGKDRYELLKCAGCNDVRLRHTNWFSEHVKKEPFLVR